MSENISKKEKAMNYFLEGYNCTQAILMTFKEYIPEESFESIMKLGCSFGGGISRLREVCGSVSGMIMVGSLIYGYIGPETGEVKAAQYARTQELAKAFEEKNGSIVCRELLGLSEKNSAPTPEARTNEYYKKRPCKELIGIAAEILDDYIKEHPIP